MLVPRVYQYSAMPPPRSPSPSRRRKAQAQAPRTISASTSASSSPSPPPPKSTATVSSKPRRLNSISAATPSQPVVIPTRSNNGGKAPRRARNSAIRPEHDVSHDPSALSPSMAALLAITSIPTPRRSSSLREARRRSGKRGADLVGSLRAEDLRQSLSSSSPKSWSILQSAPDCPEEYDVATEKSVDLDAENWSMTSGSPSSAFSPFRSLSSDSMPSLDTDGERDSALSPSPPTPAMRFRSRKDRVPSPVVPIPSDSEHPLAMASFPESRESSPPLTPTFPTIQKRSSSSTSLSDRPPSSFTSNLTASLRLLKSAARTLSAPTRLQDPNTLTISRPPPSQSSTPRPSDSSTELSASFLRSANIDALPLQLSAALPLPPGTMSIQMQPYVASPLSTAMATAPPIFKASTKPSPDSWEKKSGREPRENSEFLRMVVLEMNMRRAGKLSGEGRARVWLGPRQECVDNNKPGIADGALGTGAVTLDGEVGEAHEADVHRPEGAHAAVPAVRRAQAEIPRRWVPLAL